MGAPRAGRGHTLLLLRHGIAEERSDAKPDHERALTPKGIRRTTEALTGLAALGWRADTALHSPWRRAAETARLLTDALGGALVVYPPLAADPSVETLAGVPRVGVVALVGHEPWLGALASLLVTGSTLHADQFPFKKAGVLVLHGSGAPGTYVLEGMYGPKLLRRLGPSSAT